MMKMQRLGKHWKILAAAIICIVLITGSALLWMRGQVAEAAIIEPYHEGLVGWWRFDEGTGNTAKDSSGNANDGTIYGGATWVDGKYGKALSFDGADDYVVVSHSNLLNVDVHTVVLWASFDPEEGDQQFVKKANCYLCGFVFGYIEYAWFDGTQWHQVIADPPSDGQPHFYTFVKDYEYARIYVDSVLESQTTATASQKLSEPLLIGNDGINGNKPLKGMIDEMCIYNRALSDADVQEIFLKGPDFSANLLVKVPAGTTQLIVTVSWQGTVDINVTISSPSKNYTEENVTSVYQKSVYSTIQRTPGILNIKRLLLTIDTLSSDEKWKVILTYDNLQDYQITVETQK